MKEQIKVAAVASTDWHLKRENVEEIINLVKQQCELAVKLGVRTLFCLGDIFDSRKSQELVVLTAFKDILYIMESYNLKLVAIPGNHDKVNYASDHSFIDSFLHHPAFEFHSDVYLTNDYGFPSAFVPFWEESILEEKLKQVPDGYTVFSHFGTNASVNNDGRKHESLLTISSLKRFKMVYLGHFHNTHAPSKNVLHIPSIKQNNYGEDNKKGFTVILEDGSSYFQKSKFKEYRIYTFDIDKNSKKEIDGFVAEYANSEDNIRLEITGSQSKLKSLKREMFTNNGIDLKTKAKEVTEAIESVITDEVVEFSAEKIKEKFKTFCEEKEYNYEEGKYYIDQKI